MTMNATTKEALEWAGIGISPIPIHYKSKKSIYKWNKWKTNLPSEKTIISWFNNGENLGLVCGGTKNLCVIDFDNMLSYANFIKNAYNVNQDWRDVVKFSYKVKTRRGVHVYVFTEQPEKVRTVKINKIKQGIDIKANGGFVLAPPSVHPNGHIYTSMNQKNIITVNSTEDIYPIPLDEKLLSYNIKTREPDPLLDFYDEDYSAVSLVKQRIDIVNFVSRYSKVTKTGSHWYIARCVNPKHIDKNPSFRINTETQRGKCFSSSCKLNDMAYDVIRLFMVINGIDNYIDAANQLAKEYNLL